MTTDRKSTNWEEILDEYASRDCTQKEFCEQRGINPGSLSYQLTQRSKANKKAQAFIPLSQASPGELRVVVLELPGGLRLTIGG